MIVAIDGPAGSGKSTIAGLVANRFGMAKLDTGAMYRAVALAALERGVALDDADGLAGLAHEVEITFAPDEAGALHIRLDGRDVSREIRTPRVDAAVSLVAAVPGVREGLVVQQRRFAETCDVVAEGRDIGTVVFPEAEVKVFLTADPAERARRRVLQRHGGIMPADESAFDAEVAETLAGIQERDRIDSSRDVAPLAAAPDAVRIDSSATTVEGVLDKIAALVVAYRKEAR